MSKNNPTIFIEPCLIDDVNDIDLIEPCLVNDIDFMRPCLVNDIEYIRKVTDYNVKTKQFLECTGIQYITEKNGLIIRKVTISGLNHAKDITNIIIILIGQKDCLLEKVEIDTNKFDAYTDGNIECGTRKIIEVEYVTDEIVFEEKRVRRIVTDDKIFVRMYNEISCDNSASVSCGNITPDPVQPGEFEEIEKSITYLINKDRCC